MTKYRVWANITGIVPYFEKTELPYNNIR